jgi:hypothetical protein
VLRRHLDEDQGEPVRVAHGHLEQSPRFQLRPVELVTGMRWIPGAYEIGDRYLIAVSPEYEVPDA